MTGLVAQRLQRFLLQYQRFRGQLPTIHLSVHYIVECSLQRIFVRLSPVHSTEKKFLHKIIFCNPPKDIKIYSVLDGFSTKQMDVLNLSGIFE